MPPFSEFPKIIEAVGHEPLGFYSLVFLILGAIVYRLISRRGTRPLELALILVIIFVGFTGVGIAIVRADNRVNAQKEEQTKPRSYTAVVKFIGARRRLEPMQVSFRNGSGQVNFGCNETKTVTVSWNAPREAEQINAQASWVNTDNVKSQNQSVNISGTTATATGVISGLDRDWFGNCHGGGHGELVIQGTYRILAPIDAGPFESVQSGNVSKEYPLDLPLPAEEGLQITRCEATIVVDGAPPVVWTLPVPARDSPDVKREQKEGFELAASGKGIVLSTAK